MLPRKLRSMPKNFEGVKSKFGWTPRSAFALVGKFPRRCESKRKLRDITQMNSFMESLKDNITERQAKRYLISLAKDYSGFFRRHPSAVHIFPLRGAFFQYEFARGIADAMFHAGILPNLPKLRTIATVTEKDPGLMQSSIINWKSLKEQAGKLGLKTGFVVHDYSDTGETRRGIESAAGSKALAHHQLQESQVLDAGGKVPMGKEKESVWYSRLVRKDFDPVTGKVVFGPALADKKQAEIGREIGLKPIELNLRQIAFVRRAIYASGVAAFRESRKF